MQRILVHSCAGTSVSHFDTKEATKTFWSLSHRNRDAGGVTPSLRGAGVPGAGGLWLVWVNTFALPILCCQSFSGAALWLQVRGSFLGEREGSWALRKKIYPHWVDLHQNTVLGRQARKYY